MDRHQLGHEETPSLSHSGDWVLVLDGINQDQNIGGLLRSANAFGVKEVWLVNTELDSLSPKAIRISRLGRGVMPVHFFKSTKDLLMAIKEEERTLLGIELTNDHVWLPTYKKKSGKLALVLGSEKHGISLDLLKSCGQVLAVPLFGSVSSLNVTVAGSIALYQLAVSQVDGDFATDSAC